MKANKSRKLGNTGERHPTDQAVPIRKRLLQEGRLLTHGTRGKSTRGPRGNKKY